MADFDNCTVLMQHRLLRSGYQLRSTLLGIAEAAGIAWLTSTLAAPAPTEQEYLQPNEIAPVDARFLLLDNQLIAYREMGTGDKSIILLHGFSCEMQSWQWLQPMLARRYRTLAIDLWGFGASARPPQLQPQDWRRQIIGVMDALGLESALLIGHSMGGRVAMSCAAHAPERVRALVLLDSDGMQLSRDYPMIWTLSHTPLLSLTLQHLRSNSRALRRFIKRSYGDGVVVTDEMVLRYQLPLFVRGTACAWRHLGNTYPGESLAQLASQVTCPTFLIWGAVDRITPVHAGIALADMLPLSTEMVTLPQIGHLPHEECPDQVFALICPFVSRILNNDTKG